MTTHLTASDAIDWSRFTEPVRIDAERVVTGDAIRLPSGRYAIVTDFESTPTHRTFRYVIDGVRHSITARRLAAVVARLS